MSKHLVERPAVDHSSSNGSSWNTWSPWKRPSRYTSVKRDDNEFHLYAAVYHHGKDLLGGHYTGEIVMFPASRKVCFWSSFFLQVFHYLSIK